MSLLPDRYFWRQSIVLFADSSCSVGSGFMLSFPALLNPAILSPNSTDIRATPDQASWIAGCQGLAGALGICVLPFLMQAFGRKSVHIGLNAFIAIGFIIFVFASNVPTLIAGRIIQGLSLSGIYVTTIILAEYSDAKRRGYFITLKKSSVAIGSLLCHSMGIYWTWRQVAAFAVTPNVIAIILTFFWRESPSFLAMRGRFDECEKSYKWLHGESPKHIKNLEDIISSQRERRLQEKNNKRIKINVSKFLKKDYLLPFLVVCLLTVIIDSCGRYYIMAYIVQIMTEITGNKSIATFCTLGSDFLIVFALISSCFIINQFKRRRILFTFASIAVILMFLTSIITYLRSNHYMQISVWFTIAIILFNMFIVNAGVIPISFAIIGEIFPIEHKGSGLFSTGIMFTLLYAGVMKFTPMMMDTTGVQGTFAIYASLNLISLMILYFILIETKDKTLQEIENELKDVKKSNIPLSGLSTLIR